MNWIKYLANKIRDNGYNPAVVCDETLVLEGKLFRCYVNPWNGIVTIFEHYKMPNGKWKEIGHTICSIIIDENDNITTEILF